MTIDAQPYLQSSETSIWKQIEADRTSIALSLKEKLSELRIEAAVLESQARVFPPSVSIIAWVPMESALISGEKFRSVERALLKITWKSNPYSAHQTTVDIEINKNNVKKLYSERNKFSAVEADRWLLFLLRQGSNPAAGETFERFIKSFIPFVSAPGHNPIRQIFKNFFPTIPAVTTYLGFGLLLVAWVESIEGRGLSVGVLGLTLLAFAFWLARTRRQVDVIPLKPPSQPRQQRLVDSWSVVMPLEEQYHVAVRERLYKCVCDQTIDRMTSVKEQYAYYGTDGFVEREQLVLRLGQGSVHLYVYSFEHEIFVGWDGNLNTVTWAETAPVTQKVVKGVRYNYRNLEKGVHTLNEYDLIDLNVLSELVHRRVKLELSKIIKERAIEEEIDFTVTRAPKGGMLDKEKTAEAKPLSPFRRKSQA
jgi:hypothetical protein